MAEYDRLRVLDLFEAHRQTPGAPFDESHFLDYLLAAPKRERAVFRSFAGSRRLKAFTEAAQLEFAICFSIDDRGSNYPLQNFVRRVGVLKRSRRSSLASLRSQIKRGFSWKTVLLFNLPAWAACAVALGHSPWIAGALAVMVVLVNGVILKFYFRVLAYHRRLLSELQQGGPQ